MKSLDHLQLPSERQLAVTSAEGFRRARPELLRAAEELCVSLLAGAMHLMAELLASNPLLCAGELMCAHGPHTKEGHGRLRLIARAADGFEHPAASVARNLRPSRDGGIDFKGDKQSRLSFSFKDVPILERAVEQAEAIWTPALELFTLAELARQWGFGWLGAQIERMELSEQAQQRRGSPQKNSL